MQTTKVRTQDLIQAAYAELQPSTDVDTWSSQAISVVEVLLNKSLHQFPWYRYRQQYIINHYGSYAELVNAALAFLLAHGRRNPDDLWGALAPTAADFASELRALFDNEVFTDSLDGAVVETVVSPLLNDVEPGPAQTLRQMLSLTKGGRDVEIILDVAHGSPITHVADTHGVSRQTIYNHLKRMRKRARKEIADV